MRIDLTALVLATAATIGGCTPNHSQIAAPRGEAREAVLLTKNVAAGRHCSIVDANVTLPAVGTVIDTAAMPEYLKQVQLAPDSGYALYSIRFDAAGKPVRARLIEATIPPSMIEPLQQALASSLLERGSMGPLAARLRIDFTPAPIYHIGKSEYCDPEAMPRTDVRTETIRTTIAVPQGSTPPRSLPVARIKYEVEISRAGVPTAVNFLTGVDASIQQSMRENILRQRWKPALDDALPVESRFTTVVTGVASIRPAP
jgi:hypothetical protein